MKIETNDILTVPQAAAAVGAPRRTFYRVIERAEAAGHEVWCEVLGRRFVKRASLDALKAHYYPYYSEQHQAMVKQWGAAGGATKARNRKKATDSR